MNADVQSRRIAELTTLLEVSRQLGATTKLEPLLIKVTDAACNVLTCERATVFLYDTAKHELFSKAATGGAEIRFNADLGIAGEVVRTGSIINVPDAYEDPRFNREIDRQTGYVTRNMLTFPLRGHEGHLVGVLQVLNKKDGRFAADDESLASTLSLLAGVAIQRQILINEFAEKQKMERDLALARKIQQSMLPKDVPQLAGFDIAGYAHPADETGGDCYDYVPVGDGRIGLLIADATGHGVGPALLVSQFRAVLRALVTTCDDPAEVLCRSNDLLEGDMPSGMFVTTFFGVLDAASATIRYMSAGHGPLLRYRRQVDECIELAADTVPLGVLCPMDREHVEPIEMSPGDVFLLLTDGFFEATNKAGEQFGVKRIFDIVRAGPKLTSAQLIGQINGALSHFAAGQRQADDLTMIAITKL